MANFPRPRFAPAIDPALKPDELSGAFARYQRIHIPGIFAHKDAVTIHRSLTEETPWAATRESRLQYVYDSYSPSLAVAENRRTGLACEAVLDFLNTPAFLAFIRRLTGESRVGFCDALATRYTCGHFLKQHSDLHPGYDRLFAYVLNFTPTWNVDWGGLLAFIDGDGHVAEAYTPCFNALNLFRVPQIHCVTQVSTFAAAPRLAIAGWIHAKK